MPVTPPKLELKGHKANITALAFHPQYSSIASSSEDGTIKVWEFETGDLERTLRGHTSNSPDSQTPSTASTTTSRADCWPPAPPTCP
jgi:platelet-activating factor acetylhydrolase IB subunit alpha